MLKEAIEKSEDQNKSIKLFHRGGVRFLRINIVEVELE
jgi:hypothetical protein